MNLFNITNMAQIHEFYKPFEKVKNRGNFNF